MKSKCVKLVCLGVAMAMALAFVPACGGDQALDNETRPLKLNSGDFDGVFNPFFASSAYDSNIVSQTQISMLGSNEDGSEVTYGVNEPVVTLDYNETMYDANGNVVKDGNQAKTTVYQMVIKNDILFSDGVPLTAHDVLFNIYVYLDPNYTGSNTLYSTDIVGLQDYLVQQEGADDDAFSGQTTTYNNLASQRVLAISAYASDNSRWQSYVYAYNDLFRNQFVEYDADNGTNTAANYEEYTEEDIQADIAAIKEEFLNELNTIYNGIDMTSYESSYSLDSSKEWQGFFLETGLLNRKTATSSISGSTYYITDADGKFVIDWDSSYYKYDDVLTRDEAIQYAYDAYATSDRQIPDILSGWDTGSTMLTNFAAEDRSTYYDEIRKVSEGVPSVSGIKILDASNFNGSAQYEEGDYEMLQITINGVDPKAKWNFAFSVAPMHYYTTPELNAAAMADTDYSDNFGVVYSNTEFMNFVKSRNKVPVGAGVYQASTLYDATLTWKTDEQGNPTAETLASLQTLEDGFLSSNIVYLMRNDNFETTTGLGEGNDEIYNAKIKHVQYKVVSTTQLVTSLQGGDTDIGDPSATIANNDAVNSTSFLTSVTIETAGYGYIGINAKHIPNINVRRALMTVMDVTLAKAYYPGDLSQPIYRCFSKTSWVYDAVTDAIDEWHPVNKLGQADAQYYGFDETGALARQYLEAGGCTYDGTRWYDKDGKVLEFTFTIAGETRDHPAYQTFVRAQEILATMGIKATIVTDSRALYKLASGGLAIWAAAWSSTVDPDMYQVYHSESRATSVLNWGYDAILNDANTYSEETAIMKDLDLLIEKGRETLVQAERAGIYREASDLVMDLAVELPVYQRSDMYVYNNTVIDASSLYPNPSTYMSPISQIWKVSYIGNNNG